MELTLFQIGKKAIFPQNVSDPLHDFHVILALILSINKDVIQVHNDKNINFFYQDLIDVTLEAGRGVG